MYINMYACFKKFVCTSLENVYGYHICVVFWICLKKEVFFHMQSLAINSETMFKIQCLWKMGTCHIWCNFMELPRRVCFSAVRCMCSTDSGKIHDIKT